ncbi:TPA: glucosyltransferase domain-containing protein [Enterobacter cloacae]|nr:glucosyltransferase domain-containing protein [Enterobacter cloacae]
MNKFMNEKLDQKNAYIIALIICMLYASPFIFSSIYYVDDTFRSMTGRNGWTQLGRPLSDFIFFIFSQSTNMVVDAGRLPLIVSCLFMAHSIVYLSKTAFKKTTYVTLIICSLCYITPFFVQNIAYAYDCLSMVMSLYFCIIGACICYNAQNGWHVYSLLMLIASLCFYQTSVMAFPVIFSSIYLYNKINGNCNCKWALVRGCSIFIASMLLYVTIIARFTIKTSRGESVFSTHDPLSSLLKNIKLYHDLFNNSYGNLTNLIAIVMIVATFVSLVAYFMRHTEKTNNKLYMASISIALVVMFAISPMIPNVLLAESLILPRVLTAFGCSLFAFTLIIYSRFKSGYILALLLIIISVTTSFVASSTIKKQNERDVKIADLIYFEINNNPALRISNTTFIGTMSDSRSTIVNSKVYPLARYISNKMYDWTTSMYLANLGLDKVNFSFSRAHDIEMAKVSSKLNDSIIIKRKEFCIINSKKQNYVILSSNVSICNI